MICLILAGNCFTQTYGAAIVKSGFNRVGLYYNAHIGLVAKGNQFELGLRFYGPDAVFEKNTLGMAAAYSYLFDGKRVFCGPNLSYAFFSEKKSNSTLQLHEASLGNTVGYKLGPRFSICSTIAVGLVFNKVKGEIITTKLNYLNYDFSLGLTYYFDTNSE